MATFEQQLKTFEVKALKQTEQTFRGIALSLFSGIIQSTPVDTGRARGNWFTTTTSTPSSITEQPDRNGTRATAQAQNVILGSSEWGQFQLTNNLPYIERLENGYSNQAPAGMVRINVARINGIVAQEARKNNR